MQELSRERRVFGGSFSRDGCIFGLGTLGAGEEGGEEVRGDGEGVLGNDEVSLPSAPRCDESGSRRAP